MYYILSWPSWSVTVSGIVITFLIIFSYRLGRRDGKKEMKEGYSEYCTAKMTTENATLKAQNKYKDEIIEEKQKVINDLERRNATSQSLIKKAELTLTPGYDMVGNIR